MNLRERMIIAVNLEQAQGKTEGKILQMLYRGPKFSKERVKERVKNEERKKQTSSSSQKKKDNVLCILSRRNDSLDTRH
jgi:hypothetical protein